AAEPDPLAALHPVDDALGDAAPLGVERVGVPRFLDEVVVGLGRDLDDLGVDRREGLHLELVARTGNRIACSARGHHLELRHARLLLSIARSRSGAPYGACALSHGGRSRAASADAGFPGPDHRTVPGLLSALALVSRP